MAERTPSEQRRRELIAVALRQYATIGIEATTRTSLAAELGVDRVIVHRLYPDLDDLFIDVVDHVRTVGDVEIGATAAAVDEQSGPAELWETLVGRIVRGARAHPLEWQFLFLAPTRPDLAAQLAELRAEVAERVIGELVARADEPTTDEERRELAWGATFLYEGLLGTCAEHLAHGDPDHDDAFVRFLASTLQDFVDLPSSYGSVDGR